jgi:four helix bundle protein
MTKQIKSYKDLLVWQKSMALVINTYKVVALFPKEEIFGLTSQIKRCVVSIPSNIAEGWGRGTDKHFIQFLTISRGSLAEYETQIEIALKLGMLNNEVYERLNADGNEIGRMVNGLIKSIKIKETEKDIKD